MAYFLCMLAIELNIILIPLIVIIHAVCQLIQRGVNVRAADDKRRTALHVAANLGHNGIGEILSSSSYYTCKKSCQQCP